MSHRFNLDELEKMIAEAELAHFFDADHDGNVEFKELLDALDTDGDKKISLPEFLEGWAKAVQSKEATKALQKANEKEHATLMGAIEVQHGAVPHVHHVAPNSSTSSTATGIPPAAAASAPANLPARKAPPPPLNLSNAAVPPAGPFKAELALEQLAQVSAEASKRMEERRKMALTLQQERLMLEHQTRRYNAMMGGGGGSRGGSRRGRRGSASYGSGGSGGGSSKMQTPKSLKKTKTATSPEKIQAAPKYAPAPRRPKSRAFDFSSASTTTAANPPSASRSPSKSVAFRSGRGGGRKAAVLTSAHSSSPEQWSDARKSAYERLRGKIQNSGRGYIAPGDAAADSTAEEVGDPGMYITFGGFIEKDGADVVGEEINV